MWRLRKSPETGYGYIKRGQHYGQKGQQASCKIDQFVEKPNAETAESYITDGNYSWNSGMFVLKGFSIPQGTQATQ
jgi:mannose-1-phosphate guanylyltransferase